MAESEKPGRRKGAFTGSYLKVAKSYVFPNRRRLMFLSGGIGCLVLLAYYGANTLFQRGSLVTKGPLSSAHGNLEQDCERCHSPLKTVTDEKCSICHERTGDMPGVYTLAAHYIYRSSDPRRVDQTKKEHERREVPCADCHAEHRGREAPISNVTDASCTTCHRYGSFNRRHPEFTFLRTRAVDDSSLKLTHRRHSAFVLKKINTPNIEQACLYCHNPDPDGKGFQPIDYDRHCGECHLRGDVPSDFLDQVDPANRNLPGVESLDMIKARNGPGTAWAQYVSPNEFLMRPGKVRKLDVMHKDPWILENLKQLRRRLYGDIGLADLLPTGGNDSAAARPLYEEAIRTLQSYELGLRGRPEPEVTSELVRLDSLLDAARRKLRTSPYSGRDNALSSPRLMRNVDLTPAQQQDFEQFAHKVASACTECHVVSGASIHRVQKDQTTLVRAEFDHRAHIVDRRCLDCHQSIPMTDEMLGGKKFEPSMDVSAIHNLPGISNCKECHKPLEASNRCITCHYFHSNKTNRASLVAYP